MKISITTKLIALFLTMSLIPVAILCFLSLDRTQDYMECEIESHLQTAAESKAYHIETVLEEYKKTTQMVATGNVFKDIVDESKNFPLMKKEVERRIESMILSHDTVSRIRVLNKEGVVIASSYSDLGYNLSAEKIFMNAKNGCYIGEMHISRLTANKVISISAPILLNGEFSGVIIINFDADKEIFKITLHRKGLEDSGEIYIINENSYMITPSKYLNDTFMKQKVDTRNANECLEHINIMDTEHELKTISYRNYLGNDVLGVHAHIPEIQWCLLAEMDKTKAFEPITQLKMRFLAIFIVIMLLVVILSFFAAHSLPRPLIELRKSAEKIAKGELDNKIEIHSKIDEICALAESFEQMRKEVKKSRESLEKEVEKKTKEVAQKLAEEEKSSQAMLFILERQKRTNTLLKESRHELENKNLELQLHSSKLRSYNMQLQNAEVALKKEKQNVEKKVVERTKELKKEKEQVELLLEQKNRFINQLSHDLRTPLTPMLTLLPVSIKHTKNKEVKFDLEMILRNARYLNSLIINTLDLARLQANAIKIVNGPVNISELIKDLVRANKTTYKQYNVNAVNNAKENIFVYADELRTREIIENLVMNSLKFMPRRGTLTFNASYKSKKEVLISVSDTGIGIEKEILKKIFEEFYKADESRHNLMGTGLGLSICQKLVEKMNGRIRAESEGKNKGTTIYFTLPAYHPEKSEDID